MHKDITNWKTKIKLQKYNKQKTKTVPLTENFIAYINI